MDMKMGDALAGMGSVVDDDTITCFFNALAPGYGSRREHQVPEKHGVFFSGLAKTRDDRSRDDQDMNRRLRIDIPDGHALVVLVNDLRRDLPVDDTLKKCHDSCMRNSALEEESISFRAKLTISSRSARQSGRQFFAERRSLMPQ